MTFDFENTSGEKVEFTIVFKKKIKKEDREVVFLYLHLFKIVSGRSCRKTDGITSLHRHKQLDGGAIGRAPKNFIKRLVVRNFFIYFYICTSIFYFA